MLSMSAEKIQALCPSSDHCQMAAPPARPLPHRRRAACPLCSEAQTCAWGKLFISFMRSTSVTSVIPAKDCFAVCQHLGFCVYYWVQWRTMTVLVTSGWCSCNVVGAVSLRAVFLAVVTDEPWLTRALSPAQPLKQRRAFDSRLCVELMAFPRLDGQSWLPLHLPNNPMTQAAHRCFIYYFDGDFGPSSCFFR